MVIRMLKKLLGFLSPKLDRAVTREQQREQRMTQARGPTKEIPSFSSRTLGVLHPLFQT